MPEVTAVDGWDVTGRKLKKMNRDGELEVVLPYNVVPVEMLLDDDDEARGFVVEFVQKRGNRTVTVPASFVRAARPADVLADAGGPDLPGYEVKFVVQLLADVRAGLSTVKTRRVRTWAGWTDEGELIVPGRVPAAEWKTGFSDYGHAAEIPEEQARREWTNIVRLAVDWPKAVITFGMPIGSVYVAALGVDTFALHITGESHRGKTESAEIAMSALSSAQKPHGALYRTWDASTQAPTNLLKLVGPLPVWFDETGVVGDDAHFTDLIFRLSQGRGRLIADVDGGLRAGADARWDASVMSTGEARLSVLSGKTGLRRRVMEVYAPVIKDRDVHAQVVAAARRAHGWPLRWLADEPDLDGHKRLYERIFNGLSGIARSHQVEEAQASNVAVCAAGFGALARVVGESVAVGDLQAAASDMLTKLLHAAEDEGADVGERGLRALKEAVSSTNYFTSPDDEFFQRRWGVVFDDGIIGVIGDATLLEILGTYSNLTDAQPVLEKWAEQGRLVRDRGRYTGRRKIYVPGIGVVSKRLYLVRP